MNDEDATNVIAVSVIADLFYSEVDKAKTRALLGPLAKKEWDDCAKYETANSGKSSIPTTPVKEVNHLKLDKPFDNA